MKNNKHRHDGISSEKHFVLDSTSPFTIVESYKTARTNLLFTRSGDGCQRIAVTSALESEGKSINCVNLAITLAQNGLRVLIIDADLRRSKIHRLLGLKPQGGLSELLAGIIDMESVDTVISQTKHQNLSILPAGLTPPNPSELLASNQMQILLDKLSLSYDYIMIDTSPVCVITDATVISKFITGYLFVVRDNLTPINAIKDSINRLSQVGANIIGFIYNDSDEKGSSKKYYSRYY